MQTLHDDKDNYRPDKSRPSSWRSHRPSRDRTRRGCGGRGEVGWEVPFSTADK